MMPAVTRVVGIDLGTTNSLCAVFENTGPRLLPNSSNRFLTPSVVGMLDDGSIVVGDAACELRIIDPTRTVACFKRRMGTEQSVEIGDHIFSPQELSALVLRSLKADAEQALGCEITQAVITVPAYFNELQRQATRIAGQLAGFEVRRILNEPSAAALTYGLIDKEADKKLLVFDLGGGTFDVTLMEVFEGTLEIVAAAGESHLGGEDFTDKLIAWALKQQGLLLESTEAREPHRVARLRQLAEQAKRNLGISHEVTLRLPRSDGTVDESCPGIPLTRATYAQVVQPLIERLMRPMARALRDGRTSISEVDDVVLAGGATREPLVQALVRNYFKREPLRSIDPDHVVALGAAIQSALLEEHEAVEDVVVTDVCPFTLGIEITKQFGSQMRDGYFMPIIHRNTTIPVSREEFVGTLFPNQRAIDLRVFQGDARRVEDNLLLGNLEVSDIPPGPAGQKVAVRFTYDVNGLLEVEAVVEETGRKSSVLFKHHIKNLSDKEIEKAAKNLQRLKFYPRENVENQRLLLFAERVLGQVSPYERSSLEEALDGYERAFRDTDPVLFEAAQAQLLQTLSALKHPYDGGNSA